MDLLYRTFAVLEKYRNKIKFYNYKNPPYFIKTEFNVTLMPTLMATYRNVAPGNERQAVT